MAYVLMCNVVLHWTCQQLHVGHAVMIPRFSSKMFLDFGGQSGSHNLSLLSFLLFVLELATLMVVVTCDFSHLSSVLALLPTSDRLCLQPSLRPGGFPHRLRLDLALLWRYSR